jgi:hypothetical protein
MEPWGPLIGVVIGGLLAAGSAIGSQIAIHVLALRREQRSRRREDLMKAVTLLSADRNWVIRYRGVMCYGAGTVDDPEPWHELRGHLLLFLPEVSGRTFDNYFSARSDALDVFADTRAARVQMMKDRQLHSIGEALIDSELQEKTNNVSAGYIGAYLDLQQNLAQLAAAAHGTTRPKIRRGV